MLNAVQDPVTCPVQVTPTCRMKPFLPITSVVCLFQILRYYLSIRKYILSLIITLDCQQRSNIPLLRIHYCRPDDKLQVQVQSK